MTDVTGDPVDGQSAAITIDGDGEVLEVSQDAAQLLGVPPSSAIGRPLTELLVSPRLPAALSAGVEGLLSGEASPTFDRLELVLWRADGSAFPGELTVTHAGDDPARVTVRIRDLSGRSAMQAASARRLMDLDRTEQTAAIGSWRWIPHSRELWWSDNLYRLYGLEPGEIAPSKEWIVEHAHPDDRQRFERAVEHLRRSGEQAAVEFRLLQPDRPTRHLRSILTAVAAGEDGPNFTCGIVRDVTEQRRAEHEVAAHIAVSEAIDAWQSLDGGAARLLEGLTKAFEFKVGTFWIMRGDGLEASAAWHAPDRDIERFVRATTEVRLALGQGPPGHAWASGEPVGGTTSPGGGALTCPPSAAAGLLGVIAFPALNGDEVLAVVELQTAEPVELTERLTRSLLGIGQELGEFLAHRRAELEPRKLTAREAEILQLAADGLSGPEIARELVLSPSTVKTHFEHIFTKLDASDRASAVAKALRGGLIK